MSLTGAQQVAQGDAQTDTSQEVAADAEAADIAVAENAGADDVDADDADVETADEEDAGQSNVAAVDEQAEPGITEIIIDGKPDDWEGRPLLQKDEEGDGDFDLLAGYAFVNQDALYFMIEVADPSALFNQFDLKFQADNRRILISWTPGQNGFMSDETNNKSMGETSLSSFHLGSVVEARVDLEELGSPNRVSLVDIDVRYGDGGEDYDNLHFDAETPVVNEIDSTDRSIAGRSPAELEYDAGVVAAVVGSHEGESLNDQTWVRLGGPLGGLGYDIRMHPDNPDIMYVTDAFAGVHKSVDGGRTWFSINEGIDIGSGPSGDAVPAFCVTIDPNNPDTIWAGMTGVRGVFRSDDAGATWTRRENGIVEDHGLTIRSIAVEPGNSEVVYAAGEIDSSVWAGEPQWGIGFDLTQGVVYKSTNGGQNWQAIWRGDNLVRYVLIDPNDVNVLYLSTGIFDREAANSDPAMRGAGGVGVVKSIDGGETWFQANDGLDNLYIGSLAMHPEDSQILLAAVGNVTYNWASGIYVTYDGAESWKRVITQGLYMAVEFSTADPNIWYATGGHTPFHVTKDAGQTWQSYTLGNSGVWRPEGYRVSLPIDMQADPRDPDRVFVNNYGGGNYLTEDGGVTWVAASIGYTGAEIWDVTVHPENPAIVYANGRSGPFVSVDGGFSWKGINPEQTGIQDGPALSIDPQTPTHILATEAQSAHIFESWDGGFNWENVHYDSRLDQTPTNHQTGAYTIAFAPSDSSIVYAGFGTWNCVSNREANQCDPGPAYSMKVSQDGGKSWAQMTELPFEGAAVTRILVDPQNAEIIWAAVVPGGVFTSQDSGETWESRSGGMDSLAVADLALDPFNPATLYAASPNGGVFKSKDDGLTWTRFSVGMDPNERVVAIVVDPVRKDVVYAGTRFSGVYISEDGGERWRLLNDGLVTRALFSLSMSPDGSTLYAGTQGGGVYRLSTLSQAEFDSLVGP